METNIVELEKLPVVGLAHRGAYSSIGESFGRLHQALEQTETKHAPVVAIYFDDPHSVAEADLHSLAGVICHEQASVKGLESFEIPAGLYVAASFVGPYDRLGKAWEEFYGEVFGKGLKTRADFCFERYINLPGDAPEDELITELYAPLSRVPAD